jgi:hypothetical protein
MSSPTDPLGILGRSAVVARLGLWPLAAAERQVRNVLRAAVVRPAHEAPTVVVEGPHPSRHASRTPAPATLRDKLDLLLGRALEQSSTSSRQELYHRILDGMVPDEARILSALSDGSVSPLVNVYARTMSGLQGEPLLEHACLVGRMANVSLPHVTPIYVSHLLAQGLVEIGPEDPSLKDDYMILVADAAVLKAVKAGSRGPIAPPIERRTLQLSQLGRDLWAAASGDGS